MSGPSEARWDDDDLTVLVDLPVAHAAEPARADLAHAAERPADERPADGRGQRNGMSTARFMQCLAAELERHHVLVFDVDDTSLHGRLAPPPPSTRRRVALLMCGVVPWIVERRRRAALAAETFVVVAEPRDDDVHPVVTVTGCPEAEAAVSASLREL